MFSKTLFHDFESSPLIFVVEECAERASIVSLIEYGGGKVVEEKVSTALLIADEGFTDYNSASNAYIAIDYITSCCVKNRILPYQRYVLRDAYSYKLSFKADLQKLAHFVKQQLKRTNAINEPNSTEEVRLTSDSCDPTSSDEEFLVGKNDKSHRQVAAGASSSLNFRQPYSREECKAIVAYIISNNGYSSVKGNVIWKDMEKNGVCSRSWQSMKEHFRRQILSRIHQYTSDEKAVLRFRNVDSSGATWKSATKLILMDPDTSGCSGRYKPPPSSSGARETTDTDTDQEKDQNENNTSKSKYEKNRSKVITIESDTSVDSSDMEHDGESSITHKELPVHNKENSHDSDNTEYVSEKNFQHVANTQKSLSDNGPSLLNVKSSQTIESSLPRGACKPSVTNSFSNAGLDYKRLTRMKELTSKRSENVMADVEANLEQMFSEGSNSNSEKTNQEFCMVEHRILRCYAKSIRPSMDGPLENFVSGLCPECYSLTVYTKIDFVDADKSAALCAKCFERTNSEITLVFIFWIILELAGNSGESMTVTLAGNDGRDFFSCTEKEFVECPSLQDHIRKRLCEFIKPKKRLHRFECDLIISEDGKPDDQAWRDSCFASQQLETPAAITHNADT